MGSSSHRSSSVSIPSNVFDDAVHSLKLGIKVGIRVEDRTGDLNGVFAREVIGFLKVGLLFLTTRLCIGPYS